MPACSCPRLSTRSLRIARILKSKREVKNDGIPADWLIPQWPAPAHVRALCTTRAGGISAPPYDSFNLGMAVGDAPAAVQSNRARLAAALGAPPVFLAQVHGNQTVELPKTREELQRVDGAWTEQRQTPCTVMVADCLPVLLTDRAGCFVAALHAGWRGLAGAGAMQGQGILERFLKEKVPVARIVHAQEATDLIAWLGPCIGPTAFEVGDEVREAFAASAPQAATCFVPHGDGKWLADLAGLARQRLAALGVDAVFGNDGTPAWCTVSQPSRFFSHRRDRVSGRFAACIWLD
ncbi:MAG: peptidoglycan editing factor PgeF [Rhodoferax sp.]|nr:peptidoglycan editing factor PgeF [Rhodoferax sp.]